MKLSFALPKSTAKSVGATAPVPKPAAFSALDDDESVATTPPMLYDARSRKKMVAEVSTKSMKKRMEEEQKVDKTVYEYDEVWDKMQEAKQRQKEAKEQDAKERKPKYIAGLLNTAETRRLDRLRAEEKAVAREREAEGDEFADKEAFVTQAYKDQQAEVRKAEAEEKAREEAEKRKGKAPGGLAHFYRQLLDESEQKHEETVAATSSQLSVKGPQISNLTISKPPDFTPKSDLELAREAREEGKEIELNDDNQIVDKRDLLSAGLNLSAPNTRKLGHGSSSESRDEQPKAAKVHRAAGVAASRKEIQERRAREVIKQMEEEEERLTREKAEREEQALQRAVAKRNNDEDVQSARERYLARKRRKLEEFQETEGT